MATKKIDTTFSDDTALASLTGSGTLELSYAEEATFTTDGDHLIRRGSRVLIRHGVASRWKGVWYVTEVTHTLDSKGYITEGKLVRAPYQKSTKETVKKPTKVTVKMDDDGNWRKVT